MVNKTGIIYDIGANNGDDLPYYLRKARKVVAVEANPVLAQGITSRFRLEIQAGRLVVENVAVTTNSSESTVGLYVHKNAHVLGTTTKPAQKNLAKYDFFEVPTTTIHTLIEAHGDPLYVKLDIEGLDAEILRSLLSLPVKPPYVSAEGHDPRIFGLLAGMGNYTRFKLVEGSKVERNFKNLVFEDQEGNPASYSFPRHSAGPFGEDIPGAWLNATDMFTVLRVRGLGWYDIHANIGEDPPPNPSKIPMKGISGLAGAILESRHPRVVAGYRGLRKKAKKARRFFFQKS